MATAGTHNYRIFMERGLPPVQSITRRWLRGSLLITICILAAALGLFLYYSHQNLYGGVQRAMQARFSTVEGRLQATGTAGSSQATSESRSQSARWNSLMKKISSSSCCWIPPAWCWQPPAAP